MTAVAIVLAAGRGSRFDADRPIKLLTPIDGVPMIARTIASALGGGCDAAVVVVADSAVADAASACDSRVRIVVNPDPARGMFSSVQAGCEAIDSALYLIFPGDMPFIAPATVALVREAAARAGRVVSPRFGGERGHPVAVPRALRAEILAAPATATLSDVLGGHEAERLAIDVDDSGILRDVDTRDDLGGARA